MRCPLLGSAAPATCLRCASAALRVPAAPCPVCGLERTSGVCCNRLCQQRSRSVRSISAVFVGSSLLVSRIRWLKVEGRADWARVFGRVLLAWLEAHSRPDRHDLILANPTHLGGATGRCLRHTELVIEAAACADRARAWPFDTGRRRALVKTRPVPRSRGCYADKQRTADLLLDALVAPDPDRVRGRRLLVYDDICTTGLQLDRVARFLRSQGALSVDGVVLARTPRSAVKRPRSPVSIVKRR